MHSGAIPPALVFEHVAEASPSRCGDGFGQPAVPDHAAHVQVLHADQPIASYQLGAEFMQEVLTLVGYFFMLACQQATRLLPARRSLDTPADLTLQSLHPFLCPLQVTGMFSLPAFRRRQEGLDTEIDPDLSASCRSFDHAHFALAGHKVFSRLGFRHGDVLWSAFQGPVDFGLDPTHLRQVGEVFVEPETLWIADGLLISFALEARELRAPREEVLVGLLQIFDLGLQDLAVCVPQPFRFGPVFQSRGPTLQLVVVDAFAGFLICLHSQCQSPIPHKTRVPILNSQSLLLFGSRVEAIAEGFADHHTFFCSSMYFWTTSKVTAPTVEMNLLRVQRVGSLFLSQGNSERSVCDVYPLIFPTTRWMPIRGSTSSRR